MNNLNLKKFFLYLLIGSVALSALLGIGVILFGDFGEFEIKILLTTLTVTITSILGLACGACLEAKRGKILPYAGIVFAAVAAILFIIFTWNDFHGGEIPIKSAMSVLILAVACSHISLLSIANLSKKFLWSRYAVHIAVWCLSAFLLYLVWLEHDFNSDFIPRMLGVLSIVIAALTIITPIFHKLSNQKPKTEDIDAEIEKLKARIVELEALKDKVDDNAE